MSITEVVGTLLGEDIVCSAWEHAAISNDSAERSELRITLGQVCFYVSVHAQRHKLSVALLCEKH